MDSSFCVLICPIYSPEPQFFEEGTCFFFSVIFGLDYEVTDGMPGCQQNLPIAYHRGCMTSKRFSSGRTDPMGPMIKAVLEDGSSFVKFGSCSGPVVGPSLPTHTDP